MKSATGGSRGSAPLASDHRLDSWKEIAGYLGRTVRTIQRWERTDGLPIRRLQHGDGASVYAFKSELETWWNERSRQSLDGFDDTSSDAAAEQRGDLAVSGRAAVPEIVGRRAERREMQRAFDDAASGRGTLLAVAGETGIGKSALVEDFLGSIRAGVPGHVAGRGHSSESLAGTEAFLPLIDALETLLRADATGTLRRMLKASAPVWFGQLSAEVTRGAGRGLGLDPSGTSQPQRIKRELLSFFQEASRSRPIVLFLDDLHWADSSTLDVLGYLTRHLELLRLLVIVTYRTDELISRKHPFLGMTHDLEARGLCRTLNLQFLSRADLGDYLQLRFPGLSESFATAIFERTEGNPLFMVALLTYLSERGAFIQRDATWSLSQSAGHLLRDLPESVRGMIHRKIEAIPDAERRALSAASVQGFEFNAAIVARVIGADLADVEEQLQRLEALGFVHTAGQQELPDGTLAMRYRFVHVLYQERMRSSLPPARLADLSKTTANALAAAYPGHTAEIASRLGALYDTARDFDAATNCYLEAAQRAVRVFAYEDAIELGYRGLNSAGRVPLDDRRPRELALLLLVAAAIKAVRGFASNQLPEIYLRARDLCLELQRTTELADVLWGLWGAQTIRLDLLGAQDSVRQMQRLCVSAPDSLICVQAAVGDSLVAYYRGEFAQAKASWELALSLYDGDRHGPLPVAAGWDPLVSVHGHAGWATLALGFEQEAVRTLDASIIRAREVGHVPTLIYALFFAAIMHDWRRDQPRVEALVAEMARLAYEYQLVHFITISQFLQGRVLARQGDADDGIQRMRAALAAYESLGAHTLRSRFVAILAEELAAAGYGSDALEMVERELNGLGSARYYEAELLRLRADLIRRRNDPGDGVEAAQGFARALAVARAQRAKAFEARILRSFHGAVVGRDDIAGNEAAALPPSPASHD